MAWVLAVLLVLLLAPDAGARGLETPWTAQARSATVPLREHPRPQLVRQDWQNLNGLWQFGRGVDGVVPPEALLGERIRVPFPMQSPLSGIERAEPLSWYRRTFTVPEAWAGKRVLVHFGAVTHEATVYVNGARVGRHTGSYDGFSFDVTDRLRPGANELAVHVYDPGNFGDRNPAAGKQLATNPTATPSLAFFSPYSGIWQTVWLEAVAASHVQDLDLTPDLDGGRLLADVDVAAPQGTTVRLRARDGKRVVGSAEGAPGRLAVPVPRAKRWSPDRPFLYDLDVEVLRGGAVVDRARSYFGMRKIEVRRVGGVPRMLLNGEVLFQLGPLDQGYWPDGISTAPTDEALAFDLVETKRLGFNMTRKHVKVEPARWYHHADRLGLLVWQDMPNMTVYRPVTPADAQQFEVELREMVDELRSAPSIVMWVPFNEGWGQFDVERVTEEVKRLDPSRLVNGHSGAANCCEATEPRGGDVRDTHMYNGPFAAPPDARRVSVIGELGGFLHAVEGHEWDPDYPLQLPLTTREEGEGLLRRQFDALEQLVRSPGISAAVYTELTDVERELAGFLTYDRKVRKADFAEVRRLSERVIRASRAAQPARLPAGTRALYRFDEGAGASARDDLGGRPLALDGGAAWAADRDGGSALRLDGGASRAAAGAPVLGTKGSFTVAAWLRHGDRRQTAAAVSQGSGVGLGLRTGGQRLDNAPAYATQDQSNLPRAPYWRWSVTASGITADTAYDDGRFAPAEGEWEHVVAVVDRATGTASLFVDGQHQSSSAAVKVPADAGELLVGGGFRGAVDQLRTYDRALSAAEVWELFLAEGGEPATALEGPGVAPRVPRRAGRLVVRSRRVGRTVRTTGRLVVARAVPRRAACRGRVAVRVAAGGRTLSARRTQLRRDCTFASVVRLARPPRAARVTARFEGNAAVLPRRARAVRVAAR